MEHLRQRPYEKSDKTPSIKAINFKDTDMGITTTIHARDLRVQDISQGFWKEFHSVNELTENRILDVARTLSLGRTLTVIQEVIIGPEWTKHCFTVRKQVNGRKFLPVEQQASLTPEFIVWTGIIHML